MRHLVQIWKFFIFLSLIVAARRALVLMFQTDGCHYLIPLKSLTEFVCVVSLFLKPNNEMCIQYRVTQ